jgi:hypothetical protein
MEAPPKGSRWVWPCTVVVSKSLLFQDIGLACATVCCAHRRSYLGSQKYTVQRWRCLRPPCKITRAPPRKADRYGMHDMDAWYRCGCMCQGKIGGDCGSDRQYRVVERSYSKGSSGVRRDSPVDCQPLEPSSTPPTKGKARGG